MMTLTHSFKQIYNIIIAQQVFLGNTYVTSKWDSN